MADYNSTHTGNAIDTCINTYQNATDIQDAINTAIAAAKLAMYPIGSIYMSVESTDPTTFIGGTWERLQDRFLLGASDTYANGATGGEATHTLTTSETPAHTHDKGTMDITGMIRCYSEYNKGNSSYDSNGVKGAFYFRTGTDTEYGTTTNMTEGSSDAVRNVLFQASRAWTGKTSSVGGGRSQQYATLPCRIYVEAHGISAQEVSYNG